MLEREFEDILAKYPELIEQGLTVQGRQVNVDRKFIDLLFKDKSARSLIVELKIGTARRRDIAQLLDYAGYKIKPDGPAVRIMLIANKVPENFKTSFDYFAFEYKEITPSKLINFLEAKNDSNLLSDVSKNIKEQIHSETSSDPVVISQPPRPASERNEVRQGMAMRIRGGRMFRQARHALELLEAKNGPVDMKEIISFMSTKGYRSRTYYDLFNALVDSELIEEVRINGKKGYRLKAS